MATSFSASFLTAAMTQATARWCALASVPFLGFGLRSPPVGPSPAAQFSHGTDRPRGSASSLARLGGFPAWQPGEPPASPRGLRAGAVEGRGASQRGGRGMGLPRMEVTARCERPTWLERAA